MLTPNRVAEAARDPQERAELEKAAAEVALALDFMETQVDRARALLRCLRAGLNAD